MAIAKHELEAMLYEAFEGATIEVIDLAGDGDHYQANIMSQQFKGLTRVAQHQLVYQALKGKMGNELHALALKTSCPA